MIKDDNACRCGMGPLLSEIPQKFISLTVFSKRLPTVTRGWELRENFTHTHCWRYLWSPSSHKPTLHLHLLHFYVFVLCICYSEPFISFIKRHVLFLSTFLFLTRKKCFPTENLHKDCIPQNSYLPINLVKHNPNPAKNISVLKDAIFHSDIKYLFSELIRFTVVVRKNIQGLILCFDLTSIQIQFYIIKRDRYLVILHWILTVSLTCSNQFEFFKIAKLALFAFLCNYKFGKGNCIWFVLKFKQSKKCEHLQLSAFLKNLN